MNLRKIALVLMAATIVPSGLVCSDKPAKKPKVTFAEKVKTAFQDFKEWLTFDRGLGVVAAVAMVYFGYQHFKGPESEGNGDHANPRRRQGPPAVPCAQNYANQLQDVPAPNMPNMPANAADMGQSIIQNQNQRVITIEQRRTVSQRGSSCGFHTAVNLTLGAQAVAAAPAQQQQAWGMLRNAQAVGTRVEQAGRVAQELINGQRELHPGGMAEAAGMAGILPAHERYQFIDRYGEADTQLVAHLLQAEQAQCPAGTHAIAYYNNMGAPREFDVNTLRAIGIHRVDVLERRINNRGQERNHHFGVIINRQNANNVQYTILDSSNGDIFNTPMLRHLVSHIEFDNTDYRIVDGVGNLIRNNLVRPAPANAAAANQPAAPAANPPAAPAAPGGPQ